MVTTTPWYGTCSWYATPHTASKIAMGIQFPSLQAWSLLALPAPSHIATADFLSCLARGSVALRLHYTVSTISDALSIQTPSVPFSKVLFSTVENTRREPAGVQGSGFRPAGPHGGQAWHAQHRFHSQYRFVGKITALLCQTSRDQDLAGHLSEQYKDGNHKIGARPTRYPSMQSLGCPCLSRHGSHRPGCARGCRPWRGLTARRGSEHGRQNESAVCSALPTPSDRGKSWEATPSG
jgi:hypothetical protein